MRHFPLDLGFRVGLQHVNLPGKSPSYEPQVDAATVDDVPGLAEGVLLSNWHLQLN